MTARLYWTPLSHPSQAVRKMLDLKGIEYELVNVLPFNQRFHLRLVGFRGGTVPAVKLDGRRLQGSRQIARELDERWPEPPLYPADPELRKQVEEAERWGEEQLQPVPRRVARFGAARDVGLRRWGARGAGMPAPDLVARLSGPAARYFARTIESDGRRGTEAAVRADLEALPAQLDYADRLFTDGILTTDPPNAATLQVLSCICLIDAHADLHDAIGSRPSVRAARQLFPDYPGPIPRFLPTDWIPPSLRT
jgi:glutathione S-transferase